MKTINSIAVYCGSKLGAKSSYAMTGRELGSQMAARGIRLVFGGGRIGIMGEVADQVLADGGRGYRCYSTFFGRS